VRNYKRKKGFSIDDSLTSGLSLGFTDETWAPFLSYGYQRKDTSQKRFCLSLERWEFGYILFL
jgi:hypothetical protein